RPADRLAELAVADDVDAGLRLLPHDLGDGIGQALVIGFLVEPLACLARAQELLQLGRPDQAADVGGENALSAAFHRSSGVGYTLVVAAVPGPNNRCNQVKGLMP